MSYKRVVKRGGKSYGPYIYESYRDENGVVRKRYLGKQETEKKKPVYLWIIVGLIGLFSLIFLFNNSFNKITGFVVNGNESDSLNEGSNEVVLDEEFTDESLLNENDGEDVGEKEIVNDDLDLVGDAKEESREDDSGNNEVEEINGSQANVEVIENDSESRLVGFENESLNESEELVLDENLTDEDEMNNSLVNENETNDTGVENLTDEIVDDFNESLNESEELVLDENLTDEVIFNESFEENISFIYENESFDEDTVVLRDKVRINQEVKWVVVYNKSKDKNLSSEKKIKLPSKAKNVSVIKGEDYVNNEVLNIDFDGEKSNDVDISGGVITGNVISDGNNYGVFNGIISFFKNLFSRPSLTGYVTSESELVFEQKIMRSDFETSVDISDEVQDEEVVAVSYYTDGPVAREKKLVNGKIIVVNADDDLNYTNVTAYTYLNDSFKISMDEMNSVKLRWYENRDLIYEEDNLNLEENQTVEEMTVNSFLTGMVVGNQKDKKDKKNKLNETNDSLVENVTEEIDLNDSEEIVLDENLTDVNESNDVINETLTEEIVEEDNLLEEDFEYVGFSYYDYNNDGYVDYIEWDIPHLSNQSYLLIIEISDASHLDENRNVVEGVYSELNSLDGVVYEIPENNYLRVRFEQMLSEGKDITLYADSDEGTSIEVYEKDSDVILMTFEDVYDFEENKLLFENMGINWRQDTFDLKSVGGNVSYDYVVDPAYEIEFPQTFNVHGKLTDNGGAPLTGNYSMTFRIYNVASGGTALYTTTKEVSCDSEGIYSVILDNVDLPFNVQYYLGISVEGDSEMTPRISLTSSAYAFRAQHVSASGIEFDSGLDMEDENLTTEGNITASYFFGDGSGLTNLNLTGVEGASQWLDSGSDIYYMDGYVGIGTSSPNSELDVNGSVNIEENLSVGGADIYVDGDELVFRI